MRSKAQKEVLKYGQNIRQIRGATAMLQNVCRDLNLFSSFEVLADMKNKLEASAKQSYDKKVNKL